MVAWLFCYLERYHLAQITKILVEHIQRISSKKSYTNIRIRLLGRYSLEKKNIGRTVCLHNRVFQERRFSQGTLVPYKIDL